MEFSVHEAKTQFSKLLDLVAQGEEVVIRRRGAPVAALVPAERKKKPVPFGFMKGTAKLPKGWEKPMTDEEADAFWKGRY